jgi:hypothetical protein
LDTEPLEKIFQHKVLGILLREGKITQEVVYQSKKENTPDAMECLAVMFSHDPGNEE